LGSGNVANAASGNVGIGTTLPQSKLHVNGTAQATTFSGSGASLTALPVASLTGAVSVANGGTGNVTLTASKILVGNGTSNILQPANLHWDNTNSRLGIGTASPIQALDVIGTVKATSFVGDGSLLSGVVASQWSQSGSNVYVIDMSTCTVSFRRSAQQFEAFMLGCDGKSRNLSFLIAISI